MPESELCRDMFAYDVDDGVFECDLPKGHGGRHKETGETWDSDKQARIKWEIIWEPA